MTKRYNLVVFDDDLAEAYEQVAKELGIGINRMMMIGMNAILQGEVEVKAEYTPTHRSVVTRPVWLRDWDINDVNAPEVFAAQGKKGERASG